MNISIGLALAVFLVGFIVCLLQRRWSEFWPICFGVGLLALLFQFGGHASLRIG